MANNEYRPEGSLWGTEENTACLSSWEAMEAAMAEGRILEGLVHRCTGNLSLTVELGTMAGEPVSGEAALSRPELHSHPGEGKSGL